MIQNFSTYLFWDTDINKLDLKRHAQYIIERVIMRGTLNDWIELKKTYSKLKLKNACLKASYLDKITLNFCSLYFNIPKEKFKCYINQQSNPNYWNY